MKINYKRIHIGRRTFKTALAVSISLIIVSAYGATTSKMIFAMLGAMGAMEVTFRKSLESCLTQFAGVFFGVIVGVLLRSLPINSVFGVGIGIIVIITLYNVCQIRFSPSLPCLMIVTICTTADIQPFTYAVGRLWDTAIGLAVGMLINVLVLPYDNSLKIRQTIEYLEKEVIEFLEDMFDGDNEYPDTVKMRRTIDDMAGQLGIYSKQWIPFHVKADKRKLEIFLKCESKSRELMAQMEVLSQMKHLGKLDSDIRKRLQDCGAEIRDQRRIVRYEEEDIITNYHVEQILNLREELIATIGEISKNSISANTGK